MTSSLTCRHRKLKCDEVKPICGNCHKAERQCQPSTGITFRHQHNASLNAQTDVQGDSLSGFYAYKKTFDRNAHWVDIPKRLIFCYISDPYQDEVTMINMCDDVYGDSKMDKDNQHWSAGPGNELNTLGLEALSAAALSTGRPPYEANMPDFPPATIHSTLHSLDGNAGMSARIIPSTIEPEYMLHGSIGTYPAFNHLLEDNALEQQSHDAKESDSGNKITPLLRTLGHSPQTWIEPNQRLHSERGK